MKLPNIEPTPEELKEFGELWGDLILKSATIEERLEGIPVKKRLEGVPVKKLLELVPYDEVLKTIPTKEIEAYVDKLEKEGLA